MDRPNRRPAGQARDLTLSPAECASRRTALGLSTEELARLAGLVERTVQKLEAAQARPRPVTVVALRKALRLAEAAAARIDPRTPEDLRA